MRTGFRHAAIRLRRTNRESVEAETAPIQSMQIDAGWPLMFVDGGRVGVALPEAPVLSVIGCSPLQGCE